jgi:hypothetical protein
MKELEGCRAQRMDNQGQVTTEDRRWTTLARPARSCLEISNHDWQLDNDSDSNRLQFAGRR